MKSTTIFTILFWLVTIFTFYAVSEYDYGIPIFLCFIGGVAIINEVCKFIFSKFGRWISSTFLKKKPFNDPIKDSITHKKWIDHTWQLCIYVSMTIWEYNLFKGKGYLTDTASHWRNLDNKIHDPSLVNFYWLQLAIWVWTGFSCQYIEKKRKDYVVMMSHHIVTILLVCTSLYCGYLECGAIVLYFHDFSDITVDLLKMINYLKLQDAAGFFLSEAIFVINLINWIYWRLWAYPTICLWSATWESVTVINGYFKFYPLCIAGLWTLQFMHIWWTFLFLRIAYKIIKYGDAHEAGDEEYEGSTKYDQKKLKKT